MEGLSWKHCIRLSFGLKLAHCVDSRASNSGDEELQLHVSTVSLECPWMNAQHFTEFKI